MAYYYSGAYSITFDDGNYNVKNTWTNFRMVPTKAPTAGLREPEFTIVSIPDSEWIIDTTEALEGKIYRKQRTGDWEFAIVTEALPKTKNWLKIYDEIVSYFNGRRFTIQMTDGNGDNYSTTYSGRVYVKEFKMEDNCPGVTLSYNMAQSSQVDIGYRSN